MPARASDGSAGRPAAPAGGQDAPATSRFSGGIASQQAVRPSDVDQAALEGRLPESRRLGIDHEVSWVCVASRRQHSE